MIISLTTMVISAIIPVIGYWTLTGALSEYGLLFIAPVTIIVFSYLISMVFALQPAKPKLIKSMPRDENSMKSSLLFFGAVSSFTQDQYVERMKTLLASGDEL